MIVLAKDESSHDTRASLLKANLHDGYDISTTGLEHNIEAESTSQPNRGNQIPLYDYSFVVSFLLLKEFLELISLFEELTLAPCLCQKMKLVPAKLTKEPASIIF